MGAFRALARWGVVVALAAGAFGCGKKAPFATTLTVAAEPKANQGRHFVLLIRKVSEAEFFTDSYTKISGLVFPAVEDPSVLLVRVMYPGQRAKLRVSVAEDQPIAVYGMFAEPGQSWKMLLSAPQERAYAFVVEGGNLRRAAAEELLGKPPAQRRTLPAPPGTQQ